MKSLIIYHSQYKKNTEKIAKLFAEKLGADLLSTGEVKEVSTADYVLIGFGSGVYAETMSPKIFKVAEGLELKGKDVFVFSTNGVGAKYYNNKLIKLLESKGATNRGSFACKGYFVASDFTKVKMFELAGKLTVGHPNESDLKKAEKFILSLKK